MESVSIDGERMSDVYETLAFEFLVLSMFGWMAPGRVFEALS